MKTYLRFARISILGLTGLVGLLMIIDNSLSHNLENPEYFLRLNGFINYFPLCLLLVDMRDGNVLDRRYFLAFSIQEPSLFKARLVSIVRSPWWFLPLSIPLIWALTAKIPLPMAFVLTTHMYLSLLTSALIAFGAWDFLQSKGWHKHLTGLYILPLAMLIYLPKTDNPLWLMANPFGGITLVPYYLSQSFEFPVFLSLIPSLLISTGLTMAIAFASRSWYYQNG